jgi:uncharacterized protein (TIGR00369 family)
MSEALAGDVTDDEIGAPVRFAHLPADHLVHQLDMRVADPGDGTAAVELDLAPNVVNIYGALQGGLLATVVDVVCGRAVRASLTAPSTFVTRDLTVHYLSGLSVGPVRAVAHVRRSTRSTVVIQVDVCDADGSVGAIATVTFAVRPIGVGAPGAGDPGAGAGA